MAKTPLKSESGLDGNNLPIINAGAPVNPTDVVNEVFWRENTPGLPWDAAISYEVGNIILYNDNQLYQCIADTTPGILPTNISYWGVQITFDGPLPSLLTRDKSSLSAAINEVVSNTGINSTIKVRSFNLISAVVDPTDFPSPTEWSWWDGSSGVTPGTCIIVKDSGNGFGGGDFNWIPAGTILEFASPNDTIEYYDWYFTAVGVAKPGDKFIIAGLSDINATFNRPMANTSPPGYGNGEGTQQDPYYPWILNDFGVWNGTDIVIDNSWRTHENDSEIGMTFELVDSREYYYGLKLRWSPARSQFFIIPNGDVEVWTVNYSGNYASPPGGWTGEAYMGVVVQVLDAGGGFGSGAWSAVLAGAVMEYQMTGTLGGWRDISQGARQKPANDWGPGWYNAALADRSGYIYFPDANGMYDGNTWWPIHEFIETNAWDQWGSLTHITFPKVKITNVLSLDSGSIYSWQANYSKFGKFYQFLPELSSYSNATKTLSGKSTTGLKEGGLGRISNLAINVDNHSVKINNSNQLYAIIGEPYRGAWFSDDTFGLAHEPPNYSFNGTGDPGKSGKTFIVHEAPNGTANVVNATPNLNIGTVDFVSVSTTLGVIWEDWLITDLDGGTTFSVRGSRTGFTADASYNIPYDNGIIQFTITNNISSTIDDIYFLTYNGTGYGTNGTYGDWSGIAKNHVVVGADGNNKTWYDLGIVANGDMFFFDFTLGSYLWDTRGPGTKAPNSPLWLKQDSGFYLDHGAINGEKALITHNQADKKNIYSVYELDSQNSNGWKLITSPIRDIVSSYDSGLTTFYTNSPNSDEVLKVNVDDITLKINASNQLEVQPDAVAVSPPPFIPSTGNYGTNTDNAGTPNINLIKFDKTVYRSASYSIQVSYDSLPIYEIIEILVIHDGTDAFYANVISAGIGSSLVTWDAFIDVNDVWLTWSNGSADAVTITILTNSLFPI